MFLIFKWLFPSFSYIWYVLYLEVTPRETVDSLKCHHVSPCICPGGHVLCYWVVCVCDIISTAGEITLTLASQPSNRTQSSYQPAVMHETPKTKTCDNTAESWITGLYWMTRKSKIISKDWSAMGSMLMLLIHKESSSISVKWRHADVRTCPVKSSEADFL